MKDLNLIAIDFGSLQTTATPFFPVGTTIGTLVDRVLLLIFPLAGIVLFGYLIYGGYLYLLSQNDPKAVAAAKQTLTYAIVGFLVMFSAYFIVQAAGYTLGLPAIIQMF